MGKTMSPNGRRRWRVFARNVRKREPGCFSNKSGHGALLRRHPDYAENAPLPIPRPAFTARSLVGMSQSARKRAARKCLPSSTHAEECYKGTVAPDGQRACAKWFHAPRCPIEKYRIGERLRPCPGCKNCGYEPTVKLWMLRRGLWCYGSLGVRDISRICHGNGIVPARKARKARG